MNYQLVLEEELKRIKPGSKLLLQYFVFGGKLLKTGDNSTF